MSWYATEERTGVLLQELLERYRWRPLADLLNPVVFSELSPMTADLLPYEASRI